MSIYIFTTHVSTLDVPSREVTNGTYGQVPDLNTTGVPGIRHHRALRGELRVFPWPEALKYKQVWYVNNKLS